MTRAAADTIDEPSDPTPGGPPTLDYARETADRKPPGRERPPMIADPKEPLLKPLLLLALPILAENLLHMFVGLTDTYLAGHLTEDKAAATAAIGTVAYVLWLINLIGNAIATGATAVVARAVGARHRSLANSVTGQAVGAAALTGLFVAILLASFAGPLAELTKLQGRAFEFTKFYLQVLSFSLPFSMVTIAAGACLRGAGDSASPALAMVVVDIVNMALSAALTFGYFGLPEMGFRGIAIGTIVAYIVGGIMLLVVLSRGRKVRLHAHRLRPHWMTLKRLLRVGLPNGAESLITWAAQFVILGIINQIDASNVSGAAHIVTIRIESLSFMLGLAFMTAAATLVGQSLGRQDPARASRATWMAFRICATVMVAWGLLFILAGRHLADVMTNDPAVTDLAGRCLFYSGFAQLGFAATLVFGGALRGAGDTLTVMVINVVSQLGLRLVGVIVAVKFLHLGLPGVWIALGGELTLRGMAITGRFLQGGWKHVKV